MAKINFFLLVLLAFFVPISTSAVSVLAVLIAVFWLAERDYKRKIREILDNRVCLAILLYLALYVLGMLWTSDVETGVSMLKRHWKLMMVPFFLTAVPVEHRQKVIIAYLAGLLIMVTGTYLAWFDLLHYGGITPEHPTRKLYHVVYNPMLAFGSYLVIHELLWGGRATKWRIALAVLAVAMAINMFITEGRAGQVAFFVMLALLFLQLFKEKILWGFVLASILLPLLFVGGYKFSPNFHARIDKAMHEIKIFDTHPQTSIGYRLFFWKVSWEVFKESPLIGVGTGDYNVVYAEKNREQEKKSHMKVMDTINPHNQYVLVMCQLGLVGMTSFFLIFGLQIFQALRGDDPLKGVQLAFPLLFLTIMLSESYFIVNETGFMFALFSAVLYKTRGKGARNAGDGYNKDEKKNLRKVEGFTLLEVMVAVSVIAIAFVTLIGSQSQSVSIAGRTRFGVTSALLAQQQMTEIESTEFDQIYSGSGDFGDTYPGYSWEADVVDLGEDDTGIEGVEGMLKMVNLTVMLGERGSYSYSVSSVVMKIPEKDN